MKNIRKLNKTLKCNKHLKQKYNWKKILKIKNIKNDKEM